MKKTAYISSLRNFRVWHRFTGLALFFFIFLSALTGTFLAWKKDADWIQPPTNSGSTKDLTEWLPIDSLNKIAAAAFYEKYPEQIDNQIDRMDVRPSKGIVKMLFEKGWWEVQVDGKTGAVLSISRRHSDWIEQIHDGSIVSDFFKLISMNVLGVGLSAMVITGFWLWLGPKKYRKQKTRQSG